MSAWERQPGEPNLWYERFERYRLLGPRRSLLAVYNAERETAGEQPARCAPRSWAIQAAAWTWAARSEDWDESERARARAQVEIALQRLRDAAPAAVEALIAALGDTRWRVSAAREILDRAGLAAAARSDDPDGVCDVREMSDAELTAILRATLARGDGAGAVGPEPGADEPA